MKTLTVLSAAAILSCGVVVFQPAIAMAQAPAAPAAGAASQQEELVKISKVNVGVQKSPKIPSEGPKDKRWTPRDWLEIEVDCEAVLSKKSKDPKQRAYSEVTFKYYVYLEGQSKEKSRILTGESVHVNVAIKEEGHSVMYVNPQTIESLTGKKEGNPTAVKLWGVEVLIGGEMVGYKVSPGAPGTPKEPWWNAPTAPAKEPGLKKKSETPFSVLWSDYHFEERGK